MITAIEVDRLSRVNDEVALTAGTRAGDTNCFEILMRRYERRIYLLARTERQIPTPAYTSCTP